MSNNSETAAERIAFLRGLRAVRQFSVEPLPETILTNILEVARWTGSSMNAQPWEFVVVTNRETLQALAALEGYVKHLAGAAAAIIPIMSGAAGEDIVEAYDEGRLVERILLAAAAQGVGAAIGWFADGAIPQVREILGIPAGRTVREAISLGYPTEEATRPHSKPGEARKPLTELVHRERYRLKAAPE